MTIEIMTVASSATIVDKDTVVADRTTAAGARTTVVVEIKSMAAPARNGRECAPGPGMNAKKTSVRLDGEVTTAAACEALQDHGVKTNPRSEERRVGKE